MAEPIREQALAAFVARLQTISGARPWGGPYPATPNITRYWVKAERVTSFPHLVVLEQPGSRFTAQSTRSATTARYHHAFRVLVLGYVRGDNTVTRSTWLQRLWDDVRHTLMTDATLGGVIRDLELADELDTDDAQHDPLGAFAQDVILTMDEDVGVS